jgi:hypothetical protein
MEDEERVPDVPEEFRKKTKRRTVNVAPAVPVETKVHSRRKELCFVKHFYIPTRRRLKTN